MFLRRLIVACALVLGLAAAARGQQVYHAAVSADAHPAAVLVAVHRPGGVTAGGSGTVIGGEGGVSLVLTNAHVVRDGAHPIEVAHGGKAYPATYVAGSRVSTVAATAGGEQIAIDGPDLALLAVAADLPAADLAADDPTTGTRLYVYGRTSGPQRGAAAGYVFSAGELASTYTSANGDSGAGVFNEAGELVAVHGGQVVALVEGRPTQVSLATKVTVVRTFVATNAGPRFPRLAARAAARREARAAARTPTLVAVPLPMPPADAKPVETRPVEPKPMPKPAPEPKSAPQAAPKSAPVSGPDCPTGTCPLTRPQNLPPGWAPVQAGPRVTVIQAQPARRGFFRR